MPHELGKFLSEHPYFRSLSLSDEERLELIRIIDNDFIYSFLADVVNETEAILNIDPNLSRREILEIAAENIVKNLGASAASIRLFDAKSYKMLTFGAHGLLDSERAKSIPVINSIAGRVVQENRSIVVPSIFEDPYYKDKKIIAQRGFHSLMAVPLRMPSFVGVGQDILGSLQIYYKQNNREFSRHEILRAEMLARRVSYVMAKKKILDMKLLSDKKEQISDKIFVKLSNREGIKLKDFFNLIIPELDEFLQLYNCSLFTVGQNKQYVYLEASYPPDRSYHQSGHLFHLDHHDYFWSAVHGAKESADMPHERIDPSYLLIKDPLESRILSKELQRFCKEHHVYSILFVPLRLSGVTRHILTFFATQQRQYFTDDEIELLIFFGKEIMKALRLEFLGEMLHDFKNPAIAVAGLAARSKKLLQRENLGEVREKLIQYQDIVARETERLQDMALTLTGEGREEKIDLVALAKERFALNEFIIKDMTTDHIEIRPAELEENLFVYCPKYGLERVLDNVLHNATKAIPIEGGTLQMRCYQDKEMACLDIINSGEIPEGQRVAIQDGKVEGRGLNIVVKFVQNHHGDLKLESSNGITTFSICLPLHKDS